MTMAVAVPAMTVPVTDLNVDLSIRRRNQRREEQQGEEAENNFLHISWDAIRDGRVVESPKNHTYIPRN